MVITRSLWSTRTILSTRRDHVFYREYIAYKWSLLWVDKARAKDKTYIWVSVSHALGCTYIDLACTGVHIHRPANKKKSFLFSCRCCPCSLAAWSCRVGRCFPVVCVLRLLRVLVFDAMLTWLWLASCTSQLAIYHFFLRKGGPNSQCRSRSRQKGSEHLYSHLTQTLSPSLLRTLTH
jgi:hypothetical protein